MENDERRGVERRKGEREREIGREGGREGGMKGGREGGRDPVEQIRNTRFMLS